MERGDLEFGEAEKIQDTRRLLECLEDKENHTKWSSPSIYMAPEIMLSTKAGDAGLIKDNAIKGLLYHVKKEEGHINRLPPTIYMAPRTLRDLSPSSFDPRVVSIGPLHREDKRVQAFEGQKARYLTNLMRRTKHPHEDIMKLCVEKVYASIEKIKACYVWTKTYGDVEIVNMMIMDACFILEFLIRILQSDVELSKEGVLLSINIKRDLVLLENQIPFFILDEIFQCTVLGYIHNVSLLKLIRPVLKLANVFKEKIETENIPVNSIQHILSLLHQCYKPPDNITKGEFNTSIPSASDLDRAGVNFKPNKNPTWIMGMKVEQYRFPCIFDSWRKKTLRIPQLNVDDSTEFVLRNLIAYEQSGGNHSYVTSYTSAMDMLLDTKEDVARLIDSGVLSNQLGSNEEVANMINNISKEVALVDFFYVDQWEKLGEYYEGYWPKNIAKMKRNYFSSPWNIIALVAGIILFILTALQTIFTIKPT